MKCFNFSSRVVTCFSLKKWHVVPEKWHILGVVRQVALAWYYYDTRWASASREHDFCTNMTHRSCKWQSNAAPVHRNIKSESEFSFPQSVVISFRLLFLSLRSCVCVCLRCRSRAWILSSSSLHSSTCLLCVIRTRHGDSLTVQLSKT